MFQPYVDILDDDLSFDEPPGGLSERESWWVERQEELEAAGYMLRPRYHPDWQPSWLKANKSYSDVEDGQKKVVSVDTHTFLGDSQYLPCLATIEHGRDADLRRQASDVEETPQRGRSS
jgi:hypothetical protein